MYLEPTAVLRFIQTRLVLALALMTCLCASAPAAAAERDSATDAAALESAGQVGATDRGVPGLPELLDRLTRSLPDPALRARYVIGCTDADDLLEGYAAEMLAARLELSGEQADRVAGDAKPDSALAESLPNCLLRVLRRRKADVFVRVRVATEQRGRNIVLRVYEVDTGDRLDVMRQPFHLPLELEGLVTGESGRLPEPDREWLELFDHMFGPPEEAARERAVVLARREAYYFFDSGLWPEAAEACARAAANRPGPLFARAVVAHQLADAGQRADALVQAALNQHPDSGPLYALDGWVELRRGRSQDALMLLEQARLSDMGREGLYWYARGLIACETKGDGRAESALRKAAEMLPAKAFAQLRLGRYYWNRAELEKALTYYRRAAETAEADAETLRQLATVLETSNRPEEALRVLRRAFRMRSDSVVITRQLASLLKTQGRYEEALQVLRRAKEADPCDPALLAAYGDGAAEMWRISEAEAAYREAAAEASDFPYGVVRLAHVLAVQRRYAEAQKLLTELLASRPDYQPARLELGRILGRLGRDEEALSVLGEAAKSPQHEVEARLAMARVHARSGRYEQAVRNAQIAASRREEGVTYAALSEAFLGSGDLEKALSTARTALEHNSGAAAAHLALARALAQNGEMERALEQGRAAAEADPFSIEVMELEGELRVRMGDFREADALWQRALELNPWNSELHQSMADLQRRLGNRSDALKHYRRYLELDRMRAEAAG
ncbi:MAG: tetratricopeptide repeat protein [Planctomycetota bacterium]